MIIAFRGTEAFNLLNWCAVPRGQTTEACTAEPIVDHSARRQQSQLATNAGAIANGHQQEQPSTCITAMPAKPHFVRVWCRRSNDAGGSVLNVNPEPYRRTNLTINMTRHKRLGGVHDGFYSALFHRPAAGGSSLFEDLVGILREAAGDAEVGYMPLPPARHCRLRAFQ
jgi:hypothetical protein